LYFITEYIDVRVSSNPWSDPMMIVVVIRVYTASLLISTIEAEITILKDVSHDLCFFYMYY